MNVTCYIKESSVAEEKFETAMKRLEEIVSKMEAGDLPLEESLRLFEEGIKLSRSLNKTLEEAERKVEILLSDETCKTEPFEEQE